MPTLFERIIRPNRTARAQDLVQLLPTWEMGRGTGLEHSFGAYVSEAYKGNGVVFAVILARMLLFSEARFMYRSPTDKTLFRARGLESLEKPWPNGTTGELLARMEQDVSLAGNAYLYRPRGSNTIQRLRPDWVQIVTDKNGSVPGVYLYNVGGVVSDQSRVLLEDEVVHWSPIPDPMHPYRGMSWLTPVVREVESDKQMTLHKQRFLDAAATPNLLVKVKAILDGEQRRILEESLDRRYGGAHNAYKTMLVDNGADTEIQSIGHSFEQMTFTAVQAAGENRIASAAGVPAIVVGLKEGLEASTYSNFTQAMRKFGTMWGLPQWRSASAALSKFTNPPDGAELWFDISDIAALQQEEKDRAEILKLKAEAAGILIRVGYKPDVVGQVVEAMAGLDHLEHSGGIPVTLYEDGKDPSQGRDRALEAVLSEIRDLKQGRRKLIHRNEEGLAVEIEESL